MEVHSLKTLKIYPSLVSGILNFKITGVYEWISILHFMNS